VRIFTVHLAPGGADADSQPVLIREGFSLWAFVFGVFWALYHRCWIAAAGILAAELALSAALLWAEAGSDIGALSQIGLSVLIGFHANDWRRAALQRAGWRTEAIVAGANADAALVRWLDDEFASPPGGLLLPGRA